MNNLPTKLKESNQNDILTILAYAIQVTGVNVEKISNQDLQVIANYLKENYPHVKVGEIKEAFDLGIKSELDIDLNHYQNFSAMYVSNIIQAYKRYKMKHPPKPEPKPQLPIPEDTPKQAFDFIEKIFNETGKEPLLANWNLAFKHAEETNLITLTTDEKLMFQENVRFEIEEEMNYKRVRKLNGWIDLREILESKSLMAYECRKRILINYFNGRTNK